MLTLKEKRAIARFVRELNSEQRIELFTQLSRTMTFANQELARKAKKILDDAKTQSSTDAK